MGQAVDSVKQAAANATDAVCATARTTAQHARVAAKDSSLAKGAVVMVETVRNVTGIDDIPPVAPSDIGTYVNPEV